MIYDLSNTRRFCDKLGLMYFGDNYMRSFVQTAEREGLTQQQFDAAVWCSLLHTRYLLTPQNYSWTCRLALAFHFLFGKQPKGK